MKLAFTICDAAGAANVGGGCDWTTYLADIPDALIPPEVLKMIQDRQSAMADKRFSYEYLSISPVVERKSNA